MFSRIGLSEILLILAVFVVLFGYKKLPDLGRSLGRGLKNFKRSMDEPDEIDVSSSGGKRPPENRRD